MVSGGEPRASQTSCVSSHSSTVSSDGGGPVMLDGTEEGGRESDNLRFCIKSASCENQYPLFRGIP